MDESPASIDRREREREVPKLLSGVREAGVELLMFCLSDDLTRDDRETGGESDSRGQRPSTVRSSAVSPASSPTNVPRE